MKKITVIVPIYNVKKYLNECLDSLASQTDNNFNVVMIDDGSTDGSSSIAKDYAKKFDNFKYHYQDNKGLGGARNSGLSLANSEFIMFFDSDDFMSSKTIERLNNELEHISSDVDAIFINPVVYNTARKTYEEWFDVNLINNIFRTKDTVYAKKEQKFFLTEASVVRGIWRKVLFNNINFLEHCFWEDVPVHFQLIHKCKLIKFCSYQGAYFYRYNTDEQMTNKGGKERLDIEKVLNEIKPSFFDKKWTKNEKCGMLGFLSNYFYWFMQEVDDDYRHNLIYIFHSFLSNLKKRTLMYFYLKGKVSLKNKLMIKFLRSKRLYKKLENRNTIKKYMRIFKRVKRILKWW